jgi:predicted protein tyrosine phosphatase
MNFAKGVALCYLGVCMSCASALGAALVRANVELTAWEHLGVFLAFMAVGTWALAKVEVGGDN